jgi:hypothetical protein
MTTGGPALADLISETDVCLWSQTMPTGAACGPSHSPENRKRKKD